MICHLFLILCQLKSRIKIRMSAEIFSLEKYRLKPEIAACRHELAELFGKKYFLPRQFIELMQSQRVVLFELLDSVERRTDLSAWRELFDERYRWVQSLDHAPETIQYLHILGVAQRFQPEIECEYQRSLQLPKNFPGAADWVAYWASLRVEIDAAETAEEIARIKERFESMRQIFETAIAAEQRQSAETAFRLRVVS